MPVYWTEFGQTHLCDVINGRNTKKVKELNHNTDKNFGKGSHVGIDDWKSIIRQLKALGYFEISKDNFSTLEVTLKGRKLLNNPQELYLKGNWGLSQIIEHPIDESHTTPETNLNPQSDDPIDTKWVEFLKIIAPLNINQRESTSLFEACLSQEFDTIPQNASQQIHDDIRQLFKREQSNFSFGIGF